MEQVTRLAARKLRVDIVPSRRIRLIWATEVAPREGVPEVRPRKRHDAEKQFQIAPYLSLIVLVSVCSIFSGAVSLSSSIPIPSAGQWVPFGRNEPTISSGAFTFPGPSGVAGYFYTKPPTTIAQGQTVTLVYSIDVSTPVWGVSDTTDVPPTATAP